MPTAPMASPARTCITSSTASRPPFLFSPSFTNPADVAIHGLCSFWPGVVCTRGRQVAPRPLALKVAAYQTSFRPSWIRREEVDVVPMTPVFEAPMELLESFKKLGAAKLG